MEKLSGKTALVTGSTDGVGRLVARKLGQAGARVLVHGRDAERGARVVADIEASGGVAAFLAADLSARAEVRRLADAAQATVDRLDILINNAGIGTAGPRQTSPEGFELRFAVNYLAGFLLTLLLLLLIKNSAPARIVNVSSAGQQPIGLGMAIMAYAVPSGIGTKVAGSADPSQTGANTEFNQAPANPLNRFVMACLPDNQLVDATISDSPSLSQADLLHAPMRRD